MGNWPSTTAWAYIKSVCMHSTCTSVAAERLVQRQQDITLDKGGSGTCPEFPLTLFLSALSVSAAFHLPPPSGMAVLQRIGCNVDRLKALAAAPFAAEFDAAHAEARDEWDGCEQTPQHRLDHKQQVLQLMATLAVQCVEAVHTNGRTETAEV